MLDQRATLRQRAARALLNEIVSAHYKKLTLGHLSDVTPDSYKDSERHFNNLRALAERSIGHVGWSGDPHRWEIDDERFRRMSEAAQTWGEWRVAAGVIVPSAPDAEGLYDALCLYTPPAVVLVT